MSSEEQLEGEDLIIRSLGYLKPPESWRKRFDLKTSKSPRAYSQDRPDKGIRRLIFEWPIEDLEEA